MNKTAWLHEDVLEQMNLNYILEGHQVDASWFLHGYCQYFALALAEKFSYKVVLYIDYDDDIEANALVHAFCVADLNTTSHYVDIRGVTKDIGEELECFDDSIEDIDAFYVNAMDAVTAKKVLKNLKVGYGNKDFRRLAKEFIDTHQEHYQLS